MGKYWVLGSEVLGRGCVWLCGFFVYSVFTYSSVDSRNKGHECSWGAIHEGRLLEAWDRKALPEKGLGAALGAFYRVDR